MHRKFKNLLHQYKLDVFKMEHDKKNVDEITQECMPICEDVLHNKYSYHFHKLPDANRAEIINMINNYTREALLPPIVEGLVKRQIVLERRFDALVHLLKSMLDLLSTEPAGAGKSSSAD